MRSAITVSKYLLLFLLVTVLTNCTITEKRYKVLRVFFDGVPDPSEAKKESISPGEQSPGEGEKTPGTVPAPINKSIHPDFAARQCDRCHNKSATNFLKRNRKELCFMCHEKSDFEGQYLHGPAAVRDCLVCHYHHRSKHEKLLKEDRARICLMCHIQEDVAANEVHDGVDFDKGECTQCHDPHASDEKFLLKN